MPPLSGTKPDWHILQMLARKMGHNWEYRHPSEIMEEASRLAPMFAGVSYERLEGFKSQQWPVAEDGTDSPFLYEHGFNFPDKKAKFYPLMYTPPLSLTDEYDLHLNNGRLLEHFHEGNETYKTAGIREKVPSTFVEISPELAKAREIQTGDVVRISSPAGSVKVRALITDRVTGNEMYLPMNAIGDEAVNNLTGRVYDPTAHTPAYKELPVKLEKLKEARGQSPLPRTNPRFGHPKPQKGVHVEEKWKRKDYEPLANE